MASVESEPLPASLDGDGVVSPVGLKVRCLGVHGDGAREIEKFERDFVFPLLCVALCLPRSHSHTLSTYLCVHVGWCVCVCVSLCVRNRAVENSGGSEKTVVSASLCPLFDVMCVCGGCPCRKGRERDTSDALLRVVCERVSE